VHHVTLYHASSSDAESEQNDSTATANATDDEKTNGVADSQTTSTNETPSLSLNQQILQAGWARIANRYDRRLTEYVRDQLLQYEQEAQRSHNNIWLYGIVDEVEDEQ